jgi:hypothetical protein
VKYIFRTMEDGRYLNQWRGRWGRLEFEVGFGQDANFTMIEFEQTEWESPHYSITLALWRIIFLHLAWDMFGWFPNTSREVSLKWSDGEIWWNFWNHPSDWSRGEWRGYFNPLRWLLNLLLGKRTVQEVPIRSKQAYVYLPEGFIPAECVMTEMVYTRPRWPWPIRRYRLVNICPVVGVPVPGRGENSWDGDDDTVQAMSVRADDINSALRQFSESVMQYRLKDGGSDWRPNYGTFQPLAQEPE